MNIFQQNETSFSIRSREDESSTVPIVRLLPKWQKNFPMKCSIPFLFKRIAPRSISEEMKLSGKRKKRRGHLRSRRCETSWENNLRRCWHCREIQTSQRSYYSYAKPLFRNLWAPYRLRALSTWPEVASDFGTIRGTTPSATAAAIRTFSKEPFVLSPVVQKRMLTTKNSENNCWNRWKSTL